MADYRSILDRAVNGLSNNTEEARRAIYEKARGALMRQLSSLEPALSPAEISKQRLQLEEAVRETENQFTGIGSLEDAVSDALGDLSIDEPVVEAAPAPEPIAAPEPVVASEPEIVTPEPVVAPEPVVETPEPVVEPEVVEEPAPAIEPVVETQPSKLEEEAAIPTVDTPIAEPIDGPIAEPEASTDDISIPSEPAIDTPTVDTPTVDVEPLDSPSVEAPSVDVPSVDVPDMPQVDVPQPELPTAQEPVFDTSTSEPVVPAVETAEIPAVDDLVARADAVNQGVRNTVEEITSPLAELKETMAQDGVDVEDAEVLPEPAIEFDTPTDAHATFEEPTVGPMDDTAAIAAANTKKSGGRGFIWILLLLIIVGAGAFGWAQREVVGPIVAPIFDSVKGLVSDVTGTPDDAAPSTPEPTATPTTTPTEDDSDKAEDRIPTGDSDEGIQPGNRVTLPEQTPTIREVVPEPVQPETPVQPAQPETPVTPAEPEQESQVQEPDPTPVAEAPAEEPPAEEPVFTPPSADETPTTTETAEQAPQPEATPPAASLFAANAILYEERQGSSQADISTGNVLWELVENGSATFGADGQVSVRGNTRIQGRDLQVRFELIRNKDESLPASHVIELEFTAGPLFKNDGVNNIAGIVAKRSEQENGTLLSGAVVKVSDTLFWVALSAQAADLAKNRDALSKQNWFDIPIVFKSGQRAILTLEKANAGAKAIDAAFAEWK